MARLTDTRVVARGEARKSQAKADEFAAAAVGELEASRWTAAGLAAVHAGIAAADAALVASAGIRSASADHGFAAVLLEKQVPEFGASEKRQLLGLLEMKNIAAYEGRPLTPTEARQLADQAQRLARWSRAVVEDHVS